MSHARVPGLCMLIVFITLPGLRRWKFLWYVSIDRSTEETFFLEMFAHSNRNLSVMGWIVLGSRGLKYRFFTASRFTARGATDTFGPSITSPRGDCQGTQQEEHVHESHSLKEPR